ncbi:MAG: kelch repeat-containing protein, partial [Actinomycetota bacterium]|nr:kelch repeat-containing protein [Actinomycetota bacterium]
SGSLGDLWTFSTITNQWTWVGGSTAAGTSGAFSTGQGVADAGNWPGARQDGAGWVDTADNLWLFGGTGFDDVGAEGLLNDLWKYSTATGQWTWVRGAATKDAPATYGTQATPAAGNTPSGRKGVVTWFDPAGLTAAPGVAVTETTAGSLGVSAVQRLVVTAIGGTFTLTLDAQTSGPITWSATDATLATNIQAALDAALGAGIVTVAAAATNTFDISFTADGARSLFTADVGGLVAGKAWMYGGEGNVAGRVVYNELWQFDGANWSWVSGTQAAFVAPAYSARGSVTLLGTPGSRYRPTAWVTTATGAATSTLWLFGGDVEAVSGTVTHPNDLWRYDSGYWTWVGGKSTDNPAGTYVGLGQQGQPGGRAAAAPWVDTTNKTLWLFGGDDHADLWFYVYAP